MTFTGLLLSGRRAAESLMLDTCTVQPVTGVNETTGAPTLGTAIYGPSIAPHFGKCKFQVTGIEVSTAEAGGATHTILSGNVHTPAGAFLAAVGLVLTCVTSAHNVNLPGRSFRLEEPSPAKSLATADRMQIEEIR